MSETNSKSGRLLDPAGFCLVIIFVFGINSLFAQSTLTILSGKDNSPVSNAYVLFLKMLEDGGKKEKASALTKIDGVVEMPFDTVVIVKISHLGFEELVDTIHPNETKTLFLQPANLAINEVVVTAQYTPGDPANSVYQVEVIKKEAIEWQGAANLSDVLKLESNIRISQDNVLGSSMTMQGLSGEQVKILVDGIPVIGRQNGSIDLRQLNMNDVKRVEIIEGPVSVQYGTNAMAGVVNIITDYSKHNGPNARLNGYYESVGVYNADAGVGFGKNNHSIDLSGGRNFFDGYSAIDTSRVKEWKPKEQYLGTLKYGYGFKRMSFTAKGDAFYEKVTDRGEPRPPYNVRAFDNYYYTYRYNGAASLTGEILENHYVDQVAAFSYYEHIRNRYYKDLVTLENTQTSNDGDQDTTSFYSYLVRGFVSRNKPSKIFNYQVGYDINIEQGKGGRIENGEQTIGDYAMFCSFNMKPVKELALQAGLRWAYNTEYKAPLIPSFNIKWNPTTKLMIRASYGQGFRTPSLKELYLDFVDLNHDIHGNPDLKREFSHNVSFSINYNRTIKKHQFGIIPSFYFNDIKDLIKLAETTNGAYTYINIENYMTIGVLLGVEYKVAGFSFKASAGNNGQRKDKGGDFKYSPEVSVQAGYLIPKALVTLSAYHKFNGAQTTYVLDEIVNVSEKELDAYSLLDVSVNRQFWDKRISLTAGVKNILDVNDVNSTGGGSIHSGPGDYTSVGWGRSFFASLKFSIDKKN